MLSPASALCMPACVNAIVLARSANSLAVPSAKLLIGMPNRSDNLLAGMPKRSRSRWSRVFSGACSDDSGLAVTRRACNVAIAARRRQEGRASRYSNSRCGFAIVSQCNVHRGCSVSRCSVLCGLARPGTSIWLTTLVSPRSGNHSSPNSLPPTPRTPAVPNSVRLRWLYTRSLAAGASVLSTVNRTSVVSPAGCE